MIDPALLDLYYKDDALGDPLLSEARVHCWAWWPRATVSDRTTRASRQRCAPAVVADLDLQLVDFKLSWPTLMVSRCWRMRSALTPRLWDRRSSDAQDRILDKDRFRQDLAVMEAYGEVLNVRLPAPTLQLHKFGGFRAVPGTRLDDRRLPATPRFPSERVWWGWPDAAAAVGAPQAQETPVEEPLPAAEEPVTTVEVEEEVEETVVIEEPRVLISEVLIVGLSEHPEEERLQLEAYEAMQVRPGRRVTRAELQRDLNAVQATGWFSDVRITPENSPLGVRVMVEVEPFPTLSSVVLTPAFEDLPPSQIEDTFGGDYGRTLNLNDLQKRMKEQQWFSDQGYPWHASPVRSG